MIEPPQIVKTETRQTAFIHLTVPRAEIQTVMGSSLRELLETLAAQGISPTGPWFTHHLRMSPEVFDFRISVPIDIPVEAKGRVEAGMLPAATVARTVFHGDYARLSAGWEELMTWIQASGYTPEPDLWECYTIGPELSLNPADWRTELNRPVVKR